MNFGLLPGEKDVVVCQYVSGGQFSSFVFFLCYNSIINFVCLCVLRMMKYIPKKKTFLFFCFLIIFSVDFLQVLMHCHDTRIVENKAAQSPRKLNLMCRQQPVAVSTTLIHQ